MPTCRDVVTYSMRLSRIIGVGKQPKAAEAEAGLECLKSFYLELATGGMFGQLRDVQTSVDYAAKPGERVRALSGAAVTLPTQIDGPCGSRPPYDLSLIEVFDVDQSARSLSIWEAGRGEWVELTDLTLNSEAPLASRGLMGLAATLAASGAFAVMFTPNLDPNLAAIIKAFRRGLIGKMGGDRERATADYE